MEDAQLSERQLQEIKNRATKAMILLHKITLVNKHIEEMDEELRRIQAHLGMSDSSLIGALVALAAYSYFFSTPSALWLTGYLSFFILLVAPWVLIKSRISSIQLHIQDAILQRNQLTLDVREFVNINVNFQIDYTLPEEQKLVWAQIQEELMFQVCF